MTINPIGVQTPKVAQPQFKGGEASKLTEALYKLTTVPGFDKVANLASKNPALFNAASALVMAGMLRPAAIMALPAKDEQAQKNKGNAAAHAIASGVIGFVVTMAVTAPMKKGLEKVFNINNPLFEKYFEHNKNLTKGIPLDVQKTSLGKNAEKVLNFAPDIILAIPRALLTSKLSHKIEDILFKKKKAEPKQVEQPQPTQQAEQPTQVAQAQATDRPVLDGFKGGNN